MKFNIGRDQLLKLLNYCQGVIEKRGTLPILSNVLIEAKDSFLKITATDLDLIFTSFIEDVQIDSPGSTTTSASVIYDIVRNLSSGSKVNFHLINENKLLLESEKSKFNLFKIESRVLLKLLNKSKFSVSNDETRHYLSGVFLHQTEQNNNYFLTAAATDSHRMSISKTKLNSKINFDPIILPKKTIYQLITLLEDQESIVKICNIKSKIKFEFDNYLLISKLIDGKFPNYIQVIPKNNEKKLEINLSNSGDGTDTLEVKFDFDLDISFNSKYLIDVASQIDGEKIIFYLNETGSPALIRDPVDTDSLFVVMPMKA